jgi:endonuclease III
MERRMKKKLPKSKIPELLRLLEQRYGKAKVALVHEGAFELLVATILSAQCTDKRVNLVTPVLFGRFPSPEALAKAPIEEVEEIIRSTGFFHNKAKNIIAMSRALVEEHHGKVPRTMEALVALPGVARKTANVILGSAFGIASGIVVDTHVIRLSQLLGLTTASDPVQIERELMTLIPQEEWILFGHMLIHHGREICIARRPKCEECPLNKLCPSAFLAADSPRSGGRAR